MNTDRPNILLILTDQQRTDSLGCYGGNYIRTPNLDALGQRGTVFDRCYVNNPICTPSRASLWTGKSVIGHGVYTLHDALPAAERLFSAHLQDAGYRTALFGKLHVSGRMVEADHPHPHHGFDIYENVLSPYLAAPGQPAYLTWLRDRDPEFFDRLRQKGTFVGYTPEHVHFSTWIVERTSEFIRQASREQPFFCCSSFLDPHDPFDDHPVEYLEQVDIRPWDQRGDESWLPCSPDVLRERRAGVLGSIDEYSESEVTALRRSYYASVAFLDKCVGQILRTLQQCGRSENTLILFASDHGEMLGERGLLGKGAYFYDSCARVPLIVSGPGCAAGKRSDQLVQLNDIAATILSAAAVEPKTVNRHMPESRSVLSENGRSHVFGIYRNTSINRERLFWDPPIHCSMVRDARHKLTVYHGRPGRPQEGELYDMVEDPGETRNLWGEPSHLSVRTHLLGSLMDWLALEDAASNGGRGGRVFPDKSAWLHNNAVNTPPVTTASNPSTERVPPSTANS